MSKKSKKASPGRRAKSTASGNRVDLKVGRVNQKIRTRDALVRVAVDFIRRGEHFSVAEVADKAGVSRPTAYRYFATPELLRAQAAVFAAGRIETSELEALMQGSGSPEEKLDALIVGSDRMTTAHETEFRSLLQLSLDPNSKSGTSALRPQFRRSWLSSALSGLREELGESRFDRLVATLSLLCGIESFVVLHDILRMKPREASEVKRWAARLLLRAAIHEAADGRATQPKRSSARRLK